MIKAPIQDFDVVSRDDHAAIWIDSLAQIRAAIGRLNGTHDEYDVLSMLHQRTLMLWPGDKASAVTEIQVYPKKRVCNVFLAGGRGGLKELKEWVKVGGVLEQWAFNRWQCDWIAYAGRKGWGEILDCEVMGEIAMRVRQ